MLTSMVLMALLGLPLMMVPLSDGESDDADDMGAAGAAAQDGAEAPEIMAVDELLTFDQAADPDETTPEETTAEETPPEGTPPEGTAEPSLAEDGRTLLGTVEADLMQGGREDDDLTGYHGDDTLEGAAGNDFMRGGEGDDVLRGGTGDDTLNGNGGNDYLDGGAGDDRIDAGEGNNTLVGGEGADLLLATLGDDVLNGNTDDGSSDDEIDRLVASLGDDTLMLGEGDIGEGGAGADRHYILSDVELGATITDFDPREDQLIVLHEAGDVPSVVDQRIDATGVTVVLSTGVEISLNGLEAAVPEAQFGFEAFSAM